MSPGKFAMLPAFIPYKDQLYFPLLIIMVKTETSTFQNSKGQFGRLLQGLGVLYVALNKVQNLQIESSEGTKVSEKHATTFGLTTKSQEFCFWETNFVTHMCCVVCNALILFKVPVHSLDNPVPFIPLPSLLSIFYTTTLFHSFYLSTFVLYKGTNCT